MVNEEIWAVLGAKWNLSILRFLELNMPMRFNELKLSIPRMSSNVLAERLHHLEEMGLIKKVATNELAHKGGYVLTEKCEGLKKILVKLDEWVSLQYPMVEPQNNINQNTILSKELFKLLRNEITETEFNFIKDKLLFSPGIQSSDVITNFGTLKNIILELFGDQIGNNIIKKLNDKIIAQQKNF